MSIETEIKQMVGDAAALRPAAWANRDAEHAVKKQLVNRLGKQEPTPTAGAVDKRLSEVAQQASEVRDASLRLAEHLVGPEAKQASRLDASNNDTDPLFTRQLSRLDAIGEILDTARGAVERALAALS